MTSDTAFAPAPSTMINFDPILSNLIVGSFPASRIDVNRLAQAGVTAVVNLQSDVDFVHLGVNWPALEASYLELGIAVYRVPMIDFDEVDIAQWVPKAAECVNQAMDKKYRVYLHCTAGRERSPTTAAAWLTWYGGYSLDDALHRVRSTRHLANPYEAILRSLGPPRQSDDRVSG